VSAPGPEARKSLESAERGERLQKILARAGLSSRREAERWLAEGRISVNGAVVLRPGTRVDPLRDTVRVDGKRVTGKEPPVYYLLNKPAGCLTTTRDPQGRPLVMDLLRGVRQRVFPVGRLDFNTTGLLILTNDGELALQLLRPATGCPKVYRVKVRGVPDEGTLKRLARGVVLDGRRSLPCRIARAGGGANSWLLVTMTEGKRNQIRRMFLQAGHPVSRLQRVAIGPIRDARLPVGHYRPLTPQEVRRLKEAVA
jgi:pseudouridine synthase